MFLSALLCLAFSQQESLDLRRAVFVREGFGNLWGFGNRGRAEALRMLWSCRDGSALLGVVFSWLASCLMRIPLLSLINIKKIHLVLSLFLFFFLSGANFVLRSWAGSREFEAGCVCWERRRLVFSFVGRSHSVNAFLHVFDDVCV